MKKEHAWRYSTLGILLTALAVFVIIQMLRIQLSPEADTLRNQGEIFSGEYKTITPARGQIYDRWGHLLAGNKTVYEAGVDLIDVVDPTTIAFALNAVVGVEYEDVYAAASQDPESGIVYATLARFVTEEQKIRLEELADQMDGAYGEGDGEQVKSLAGLRFTPSLQRSYPEKVWVRIFWVLLIGMVKDFSGSKNAMMSSWLARRNWSGFLAIPTRLKNNQKSHLEQV